MTEQTRTLAQLAQEALDVQDACNLSGVALGFGRAMADLRQHVGGGDAIRQHPITLLWIDKLADMTGRVEAFATWHGTANSSPYDKVQRLAAGTGDPAQAVA
jgi:hypothetical protein